MTKPTAEEIRAAIRFFDHNTTHYYGDVMAAAYLEAIEALHRAQRFISNGIEFGYIRVPDKPDPALDTLPAIDAVLAKAPKEDG